MAHIKLGDCFSLKNHPYHENYFDTYIGADATFTPPVMVVCETLNTGSNHNVDDGSKEINQIRGLFYSSKTHKYERHWFKIDEIKVLISSDSLSQKIITSENKALQLLKTELKNSQVVLNSVNIELEKSKISQETRNINNTIFKRNPYLEFAPPVMTIIDVRLHEHIKDNYHKNTGVKKRTHSEYELKCKWYNPHSDTFSEDWIPMDCTLDVTPNFDISQVVDRINNYFELPLENTIIFEEERIEQISTIIKFKEIVFYHYRYMIIVEDILNPRIFKIDLEKAISLKEIVIDDFLEKRIPNTLVRYPLTETEFETGNLYEIFYLSDRGVSTNRFIYVTDKYEIGPEERIDYIIVANCFLRNGQIRNFKLSNIKSSRKVNNIYLNQIIQKFTIL